jgi:hypothetical protein
MTDISEAELLAFIAREQVALVLEEAENAEDEARAFSPGPRPAMSAFGGCSLFPL